MMQMMDKQQMRQRYLQMRNELSDCQVAEWSQKICEHLVRWEAFLQAKTIYFYYPLGNEVDLLEAAGEALRLGKQVAFPKTEGDRIRFFQVENLRDFREGCFHVMEPVSHQVVEVIRPLILTPGLVFDCQKNRMGYGRGYYDRYTADYPEAVRVGITYENQITGHTPIEKHAMPMRLNSRIWIWRPLTVS